jgi:hypothetical protein
MFSGPLLLLIFHMDVTVLVEAVDVMEKSNKNI